MSIIEVRYGRKAKARQPHKMLVVQGELTRIAERISSEGFGWALM